MKTLLLAAALILAPAFSFAADSNGLLPDHHLTPGAVRTTDVNDICNTKTSTVRHVTGAMKERVRKSYGLSTPADKWCNTKQGCEIDHLIPLWAGGSNEQTNLWPQPFEGEWNAHHKDHLEQVAHAKICDGSVKPEVIQHEIATDWIAAYKKYVGEKKPVAPSDDVE